MIYAHRAACIQRLLRTSCKIVPSNFAQSNDLEIQHVKQSVLGLPRGEPIMGSNHPVVQALFKTQTCVYHLALQFVCH